jgi:signal transduction histidine kinase/streptogramin lyase
LWATTHSGLLIFRRGETWSTLSTDPRWPGGRASAVTADAAGAVWVGTRDRALHCWRDGRFSSWHEDDGLSSREIHALLVSTVGDVWIGQTGPDVVQRLRDGRLTTFEMPSDVRVIRAMVEDANGDVWIGSSKGRLVRISGDTVIDETGRTTGEPLSIRCLHATQDGGLWIGYADEGMGWLKDRRFAHLTSARGFPENNVSQILSDEQGWLWFAGDHGIFKARQRDLEALAERRIPRAHYVRYGQSNGLFSMEANCGDSPGALRSCDGRLWIPMRSALAVIHPDRLLEDLEPPVILLKRVAVDDETVASYGGVVPVRHGLDLHDAKDALRLPPRHHRIDFEFTALSFGAPENARFRYRLEGYDDRWIDGGDQRSASFSRLAYGSYRFHVQACNSEGIWNERGAALAFVVSPFLWQTWWFRLAGLAVFTSFTAAVVRAVSLRRVRLKLRSLEQAAALDGERARIARDIHDDLGSRLTEVELLIDQAQRAPATTPDGNMRQISSTVRRVGESLDEIVWAINPRHDTLPHLINYLGQCAIEFLETAGVRCRVDLPDEPPDDAVLPEVRHNLFLAAKEALNNVARHAQATEVWLRVSLSGGSLNVAIEDNGKGFSGNSSDACADGLRNMRQRMEAVGGRLRIESGPGDGTRVLLTLPWPPETKSTAGGRTPGSGLKT